MSLDKSCKNILTRVFAAWFSSFVTGIPFSTSSKSNKKLCRHQCAGFALGNVKRQEAEQQVWQNLEWVEGQRQVLILLAN